MYQILNLPDYMKGLWGIKTPNDDKHSDATDLEFLCFDISHKAMVYVLYDTRARDQPTWLKSGFKDQDLQVVSHTDVGMGGGSASGGNVDIRWDPNYGAGQVANQQTAGGGHMETFPMAGRMSRSVGQEEGRQTRTTMTLLQCGCRTTATHQEPLEKYAF